MFNISAFLVGFVTLAVAHYVKPRKVHPLFIGGVFIIIFVAAAIFANAYFEEVVVMSVAGYVIGLVFSLSGSRGNRTERVRPEMN